MGKRGIVIVAGIALMLLCGCATHQRTNAVAQSTESDGYPSALSTDLVGTWSGSFVTIAGDGGGPSGKMTLAIKDDGTYTATEQRRASTWNSSGVVLANGDAITFQSSSGRSISLRHRGDTLYGIVPDRASGYTLQISIKKEAGVLASPPSAESPGQ